MISRLSIYLLLILLCGIIPSGEGQNYCQETTNSIAKGVSRNENGELIWTTTTGLYIQNDQEVNRLSLAAKIEGADGPNWGIQQIHNDEYFIFYLQSGLLHYSPDSATLHPINASQNKGIHSPEVHEMLSYGDTAFLATSAGLSIYSLSKRVELDLIQLSDFTNKKLTGRYPNLVRGIQFDKNDPAVIWGCGTHGIFSYHIKKNEFLHHPFDKTLIHPFHKLNNQEGFYLLTDIVQSGNQIYLSSWGGGIIRYDIKNKSWANNLIEKQTNLPNNVENVTVNLAAFNDSLLLVTLHNLPPFFFNTNRNRMESFEKIMGVTADKNKSDALHIAPPFIWIAYKNRICRYLIPQKYLSADQVHSAKKIFLTNVASKGITYGDAQRPTYSAPTKFNRENRNLSFRFATTGFPDPQAISFEYLLQGFDQDWQPAGNNNQINYPQLSGGEYTLKVRAQANNNFIYMAPYDFHIDKQLWEQWWLYALLILAFSLIATPIYLYLKKLRKDKLQAELKHKMQLQEAELSALRAQMNPHFLFNSLASINQYIMYEDPRTASKYLAKFSHLMRRILNNSQKKLISLEEELSTLELYIEMENIRFDEKFNFSAVVDPALDISSVFLPTMILQPFLENAILHGLVPKEEKGNLLLLIKRIDNKSLKIIIEDNGIGREAADRISREKVIQNDSLGMKITNDRLDLIKNVRGINAELQIEDLFTKSGQASGTRVHLSFPLIQSKN